MSTPRLVKRRWSSRYEMYAVTASIAVFGSGPIVSGQCTSSWTRVNTPGPSARGFHGMAYDSVRGVTVLFGGTAPNGAVLGDTWEWDGASWTLAAASTPATPAPREAPAMAFDPVQERIIMFGGGGSTLFSGTFAWDGKTWEPLSSVSAPGARRAAAMVFDEARDELVLFGGAISGTNQSNATYAWDRETRAWIARNPFTRPPARRAAGMCYDSTRSVVVMFGGKAGPADPPGVTEFADTWEWNGVEWSAPGPEDAPPRRSFSWMTYDSMTNQSIVFGGGDSTSLPTLYRSDTWTWAGSAWRELEIGGPQPRTAHAMAFDSKTNLTMLFGGAAAGTTRFDDTWVLETRCPADVNCNRIVNSQDFFDFLSCFFIPACPGGDFNQDGTTNSQDFFDFLGAFFNGC